MCNEQKGNIAVMLLFLFTALPLPAKYYSNADVMEQLAPKHRRHKKYSTAEMFQMDMPKAIRFQSVAIILNGTYGWASSQPDGYGSIPVHFGKIYIRGLYLPQGNMWEGTLYYTGRSIIVRNKLYPEFQLHPQKKK